MPPTQPSREQTHDEVAKHLGTRWFRRFPTGLDCPHYQDHDGSPCCSSKHLLGYAHCLKTQHADGDNEGQHSSCKVSRVYFCGLMELTTTSITHKADCTRSPAFLSQVSHGFSSSDNWPSTNVSATDYTQIFFAHRPICRFSFLTSMLSN